MATTNSNNSNAYEAFKRTIAKSGSIPYWEVAAAAGSNNGKINTSVKYFNARGRERTSVGSRGRKGSL